MTTANLTSNGWTQALVATSTTANGAAVNCECIRTWADGDRNAINATSTSGGGYPTIYARNYATSGGVYGVYGASDGKSLEGYGVYGSGPSCYGVYGDGFVGVRGNGVNYGVYGTSKHFGVYGSSSTGYGVYAEGSFGVRATGTDTGVYAEGATGVAGFGTTGVAGVTSDPNGTAVRGIANADSASAYATYGLAIYPAAYAGYFNGQVYASSFSAGSKSFLIDHPLDPENKVLRHSSVESSERKNLYDGVGTAGPNGELKVQMPAYIESLNEDFRYQLTAVGSPAPYLHVKVELLDGEFVIGGAAPGQRVCWSITGNRKDALARATPLLVEQDKADDEKGFYLNPEAHGQPKEKGIDVERQRRRGPERSLSEPMPVPARLVDPPLPVQPSMPVTP